MNCTVQSRDIDSDAMEEVASRLVQQTLTTAVAKLEGDERTTNHLQPAPKS